MVVWTNCFVSCLEIPDMVDFNGSSQHPECNVSFGEFCFLQGVSESRSSAGKVFGWPCTLTFWGFTKHLFLWLFLLVYQCVYFSSSPSLSKCMWSRGSSWIKFSSYTLLLEWLKSFLTFLEALFPTDSTPQSSAFHVLCLFQVRHSPLTGQTICWEHPVQPFPNASWAGEMENL